MATPVKAINTRLLAGFWPGISSLLALGLMAWGWQNLNLQDYYLAKAQQGPLRAESSSANSAPPLYHFKWRARGVTTWGDLHLQNPGLELERELVVASYKCTKRDSRQLVFEDVKGIPVATGEVLMILLRKGECPSVGSR